MQTLGISSPEDSEDSFLQRLFWPSVRNHYDADLIGRRGFWIAFVIGIVSAVVLLVGGHWILAFLTLLTFVLGAAGIQRRSTAAAGLIFTLYFIGIVVQWSLILAGRAPLSNPLLGIVCAALLLACVRATAVSYQLEAAGDTDFPSSEETTGLNGVANSLPRLLWPRLRIAFFVLASLMLMLNLAGFVFTLMNPAPTAREIERTPSATLEVR